MRGECTTPRVLDTIIPIQPLTITDFFFSAIQGLKHCTGPIENCQIQPGCTVKAIYSKERSKELGHFNQIMGNPVNSLFGKKPLHRSLNLKPESPKHNAQISR